MPEQAEAVRFAADKVLAGWSLSNIAADLAAVASVARTAGRSRPGPSGAG